MARRREAARAPLSARRLTLRRTATARALLQVCSTLEVALDAEASGRYVVSLTGALANLAALGFENKGRCSAPAAVPEGWPGALAKQASKLCWAYPMEGMADHYSKPTSRETELAFLALTCTPELRFAAYGGFLLLDEANAVMAVQVRGEGLAGAFRARQRPPAPLLARPAPRGASTSHSARAPFLPARVGHGSLLC